MNRRRFTLPGLVVLTGALMLPLRHVADNCCTATLSGYDMKSSSLTRSLAAGIQQPVNGDEEFFNASATTGPSAPSSIVFLLDNSGSMTDFPQCANGWGSGACNPTPAAPANPTNAARAPTYTVTCTYSDAATGTGTAWLGNVTPTTTSADPGYNDGSGFLVDAPPWSTAGGCTGDACLFQPTSVYEYGDWNEISAQPSTNWYNSGDRDYWNNAIAVPSTACNTCLTSKGICTVRVRYVSNYRTSPVRYTYGDWVRTIFRGSWLNANPPKYIVARKAVKNLVRIDPASPKLRDHVRYGLTTFWNASATGAAVTNGNNSSSLDSTSGVHSGDGATLLVPLGPDCGADTSTKTEFVTARQAIINAINSNGTQRIRFQNYTPLAESLFNIGQYFGVPGGTGDWDVRFTSTWSKTGQPGGLTSYWGGQDFRQCSPGVVGASWSGTCNTDNTGTNPDQRSVCWSCQISSAIIVTDGMPNNEGSLPASGVSSNHALQPKTPEGDAASTQAKWDFQRWTPTEYSASNNCGGNRGGTGDKCGGSYLPLVALYLSKYDQIPETTMVTKQSIITHTISFGISDATALTVLQATANLGGGLFANVSDATELEEALTKAVNNVVARQTAFSSANANALQTNRNQASETYFARFKPQTTGQWEGHLIQAMLFDEFAMGCDPSKKYAADKDNAAAKVQCGNTTVYPNFNKDADANGNNVCDGVYLVDQDCDEIIERGTDGAFVKVKNLADANVPWDAGKVMCDPAGAVAPGNTKGCTTTSSSFVSAAESATSKRNIYTYLGQSSGLIEFTTANAAALGKAMALDPASCIDIMSRASACPSGVCPTTATFTATHLDTCTKLIIYFVRGYDVFDVDGNGCRSPINSDAACAAGQERSWKLGDVFHSTPAVVKPPAHVDICDSGYDTQCAATIHSPSWLSATGTVQTDIEYTGTFDAYSVWRNANVDRQRVVLVGANDGMLHAFDAGSAVTSGKRDVYGSVPYTNGTGKELWAFIPPDLLPRLRLLTKGHQYMVDGSTMVRDVWVDGGAAATGTKDATKQSNEFHTLAVVSERSGGTQFVGLDVSDPVNPPKYLWTFPPPCGDDARWMAESWTDFAPRAPPIGPVKMKSSAARGFDEQWVVMLNGGYDPAMVKGRAVFMVDVWTGKTIWRFTGEDVAKLRGVSTKASMFPVAASVGLTDIGDPSKAFFDNDGFFDTATWGDLGGNVWVARFDLAGDTTGGTDGRVANWFAARAFEEQRNASDDTMGLDASANVPPINGQVRSPFFYMTANSWEAQTHTLRTFLGSGNRERMMAKGANCGPDDVWGCIQSGCSKVTTETTDSFSAGGCVETQKLEYDKGVFTYSSSAGCGTGLVCAVPSKDYKGTTAWDITCGSTNYKLDGSLTCDSTGVCSSYTEVGAVALTTGLVDPSLHDRFYGIWAYGGPSKDVRLKKTFKTQGEATTFDDFRFTDVPLTGTECGGGTNGKACTLINVTPASVSYDLSNTAALSFACGGDATDKSCIPTVADPGWYYEYGRVCQQSSCDPAPPWVDERTASGANVVLGCASWSGFRPTAPGSSSTSTDVCSATPPSTSSYAYLSDFMTGLPSVSCGFMNNGTVYRSYERNTWSPPSTASARVTFNSSGQVAYSVLNLDPGSPPGHTTVGIQEVGADPVYQIEVPHDAHLCRHVDNASCE